MNGLKTAERAFSSYQNSNRFYALALPLSLLFALLVLPSCASKPPKETKLKSELVAAFSVNPNRRGTPQPVKVHVYYLKQDEAFGLATFSELVAPDAPVIASDLVRRADSLIGPGETLRLDQKFDPATSYIGVVAEFTGIDNAQWRALVPVPKGSLTDKLNPFSNKKLLITLEDVAVNAEVVKE